MSLPLTKCFPLIGSGVLRPGSASSCAGMVVFLPRRAMADSVEFGGWSRSVGSGHASQPGETPPPILQTGSFRELLR